MLYVDPSQRYSSYAYQEDTVRSKGTVALILNIILHNVRQHNYFITQGNYIGYIF